MEPSAWNGESSTVTPRSSTNGRLVVSVHTASTPAGRALPALAPRALGPDQLAPRVERERLEQAGSAHHVQSADTAPDKYRVRFRDELQRALAPNGDAVRRGWPARLG